MNVARFDEIKVYWSRLVDDYVESDFIYVAPVCNRNDLMTPQATGGAT